MKWNEFEVKLANYEMYLYNSVILNFTKQIYKMIKYPIYPNNDMKLIHMKLHETSLLTKAIAEQLTDLQLLKYLYKAYIKLLNK